MYRAPALAMLTGGTGALVLLLALLSAVYVEPDVYRDLLSGYDPPFDAIAGLLLLALALRVRDRTPAAWIASLVAPGLTLFIAALSPNVFSILAAIASTVYVSFIYPYRTGFYRGTATGPESTELFVLLAALLTLLFGMVGSRLLAGEFTPPIQNWTQSLYFTVSTVSTNGSVYSPNGPTAYWFTVLLILFGVGTFLTAVVVLFLPFLERRLRSISARVERAQMEELSDHVIVCGTGGEARATADALRELGIRTLVLSVDASAIEAMRSEGYRTHLGEPSSEEVLRVVGIGRARALVAALESYAEYLLTGLTARGMAPGLRIVAVAKHTKTLPKLQKAGANETISLVNVAARLVSAAALERSTR